MLEILCHFPDPYYLRYRPELRATALRGSDAPAFGFFFISKNDVRRAKYC
jgi:hypothetical protein